MSDLHHSIAELRATFQEKVRMASSSADIEALRIEYLGKKGPVAKFMPMLSPTSGLSSEERLQLGQEINVLKQEIALLIDAAKVEFQKGEMNERIAAEKIDITLPGRKGNKLSEHPIRVVQKHLLSIMAEMGFQVQYGPDIDSDYYNYEGLNFPPDHPARDMQDTLWIDDFHMLRSHTSNTQLRVMQSSTPPIRIAAPGSTFRNETITARSHVFFHQIEGVYIDKNVTFTDLLATMKVIWKKFFEKDVAVRFRPSYFPFVEPGMEVDVSCLACGGKGCGLCKRTGWLEVAGAGMIHPNVLRNGGIDPEVYSGFAWGIGVERLTMLKYGIDDIRRFFDNDARFLSQF